MLRSAIKTAILRASKSRCCLSSMRSCSNLAEKANPQEKANEVCDDNTFEDPEPPKREESERLSEFRNKLKKDIAAMEMNRYNLMTPNDNDPLPPWPNNVNPHTGEVNGPKGPEPTRYGDWERKGICVDF